MKTGFWAGVTSAIIAGMAIFFAQQAYSSWRDSNARSASFRVNDDAVSLTRQDLPSIEQALRTRPSIRIASVIVTNNGSHPIVNSAVHFSSQINSDMTILAYGTVPSNGADASTIVIQPQEHGFNVNLRSLDRGSSQTFWVAYNCCEIFSISPLTENLSISQSISDYDEEYLVWIWLERAVIFLVALLLGGILESTSASLRLKRRGYNLSELLKKPIVDNESSPDA